MVAFVTTLFPLATMKYGSLQHESCDFARSGHLTFIELVRSMGYPKNDDQIKLIAVGFCGIFFLFIQVSVKCYKKNDND